MLAAKEGAGLEEEHGVVGGGGQTQAKKPHHRGTTPVGRRASCRPQSTRPKRRCGNYNESWLDNWGAAV